MEIFPITNHETLPDMPSATNDDHDGRYFTETEMQATAAPTGASLVGLTTGVGSPTVDTLQQYLDNTGSSGFFTGGILSDGGSGTLDVSAGEGFIRTSADDNAPLISFKWSASAGIAIADDTTQYVFVNDAGTINLSTDEFDEAVDNIMLGVATDEGGLISHTFNLGVRLQESIGQMGRYIRHVDDVVRNRRKGGLLFGESGDANRFVTVTAGQLEWGRTSYPIPAFNTSGADTFDTYTADGVELTGISAWPNTNYDDGTVTLATLGNNKWAVLWWYIEPDGHIVMLYGRGQYVTEGQAEDEPEPTSSIPNRLSSASVIAAKFIFQEGSNTTTKIETAFGTPFTGSGVTAHNNLATLAWTSAGHTGTASTVAAFDGGGVAEELTKGIADDNLLEVDGSPNSGEYAKFTANGLEGKTFAETLADLSGDAGATFDWNSQNLTGVGTITSGNITISSPTPILVFKDSNSLGAASVGYIEWRDSGGGRAGFLGNHTSSNDDLLWKNEQGGNIGIETTGGGVLQIFANTVIPDAGYIGSVSDTDAIQIEADGDVVLSQDLAVTGTLAAGATTLSGNLILAANSITGTSVNISNAELQQLSNIGANTIGGTQWDNVANLDQNVGTDGTPNFEGLTLTDDNLAIAENLDIIITNNFKIDSSRDEMILGASGTFDPYSGYGAQNNHTLFVRQTTSTGGAATPYSAVVFSNNQTGTAQRNIAQFMFANEAIGGTEKRIAQFLIQTDNAIDDGRFLFRTFNAGVGFKTTVFDKTGKWTMPGDLQVDGALTVTGTITDGGSDPPYVLYYAETRESVAQKVKVGVPVSRIGGAVMFFNSVVNRFEVYRPLAGKYYDLQGSLLETLAVPVYAATEVTKSFYLNRVTGEVEYFARPVLQVYKIKEGFRLDSKTGKVYSTKTEDGELVNDKEELDIGKWRAYK